jgi:hypothetical protein
VPIVETRSQVLERTRNRLAPGGGALRGDAKEAFERVERALSSPETRREVPIETIVVEWDDEKPPPVVHQTAFAEMEWYPLARHIVSGVYAMRDRVTRLPRLDKLAVAAAIFTHVAQELHGLQLPNHEAGKDAEDTWMAKWTADWWHWAATNKNLPVRGLPEARLVRKISSEKRIRSFASPLTHTLSKRRVFIDDFFCLCSAAVLAALHWLICSLQFGIARSRDHNLILR